MSHCLVSAFPSAELLFILVRSEYGKSNCALLIVPLKFIVRVERLLTKLIFFEQNHSTKMFSGTVRLKRD